MAGGRRQWVGYVAIVIVALLARLVCLWEIKDTVVFSTLLGDAYRYDEWAVEIAGGEWLGDEVFYQAPTYPYFLATVYRWWGRDLLVVRLLQIAVGAATCLLVAAAASAFFDRRVGLVAGLLAAVYPGSIFFDLVIQKTVLEVFFIALVLAMLGSFVRTPRWQWLAAVGAALGLAALTRENARILYVVLLPWLFYAYRGQSLRKRVAWIAAMTIGMALVLVPAGLRNWYVGGEFLLSTSQLGPNFYIGNNPRANGQYQPLREGRAHAEFERTDATELAEAAMGRRLTPDEVSRYWMGRSWDYIRQQPGHWLRLLVKKWLMVWNRVELTDTESIEVLQDLSVVLGALGGVFHFGVLSPLAAVGAWTTRREWRRLMPLYLIVLTLAGSVAVFYIFARYRFSVVPVLLMFAAAGLCEASCAWRKRDVAWWVGSGAVAAVAAFVVNWRLASYEDPRALTYFNLGSALARQSRHDEAVVQYAQAIVYKRASTAVRMRMASSLESLGRAGEAAELYRDVLRLAPRQSEAHYHLGYLAAAKGDYREAIVHYRATLASDPRHVQAANNLAWILATSSDATLRNGNEAVALAERACRSSGKEHPPLLDTLAAAYAEAGRLADAVATADRAISLAAAAGQADLESEIRAHREHYAAGRPLRSGANDSR